MLTISAAEIFHYQNGKLSSQVFLSGYFQVFLETYLTQKNIQALISFLGAAQ